MKVSTTKDTYNLEFDGFRVDIDSAEAKIHADCADIALREVIVLNNAGKNESNEIKGSARYTQPKRTELTAKRSKRHDFPTPESPISTSLNK